MVTIVGEAALVGMACGLALEETFQILTVLAFPPFTAALRRGARGCARVAGDRAASASASSWSRVTDGLSLPAATSLATWTIFSLGLALIGTFIHAAYREPLDPLDAYRNAQALIRELIGLSDEPQPRPGAGDPRRRRSPARSTTSCRCAALVVHVPRGDS